MAHFIFLFFIHYTFLLNQAGVAAGQIVFGQTGGFLSQNRGISELRRKYTTHTLQGKAKQVII